MRLKCAEILGGGFYFVGFRCGRKFARSNYSEGPTLVRLSLSSAAVLLMLREEQADWHLCSSQLC